MCDVKNLLRDNCVKTAGGTKAEFYAIPASEIVTEPALKTTTNAGDTATLDGGFTLVTTTGLGYWRKIQFDPNTGNLTSPFVGDDRANGAEHNFACFLAGTAAKQKEAAKFLRGTALVLLVTDRNGETHKLGSVDDPIYMAPGDGLNTQTAISEKSGIALAFSAENAELPPTYELAANALNFTPAP